MASTANSRGRRGTRACCENGGEPADRGGAKRLRDVQLANDAQPAYTLPDPSMVQATVR